MTIVSVNGNIINRFGENIDVTLAKIIINFEGKYLIKLFIIKSYLVALMLLKRNLNELKLNRVKCKWFSFVNNIIYSDTQILDTQIDYLS